EAACRALAEARSVDEVKGIRDRAVAMAAYAPQARNRDLEADAVEIRLRATRRLDQMRVAQKETIGLNRGAAGGGKKGGSRGVLIAPCDDRPTLASQGIGKNSAVMASLALQHGASLETLRHPVLRDWPRQCGNAARCRTRSHTKGGPAGRSHPPPRSCPQ